MEEKLYTLIFADGTEMKNLALNGNNFICEEKIDPEIFINNLSPVIIDDGEKPELHDNMALVQISTLGGKDAFILRDISNEELKEMKLRADIEYIAMMANVDL